MSIRQDAARAFTLITTCCWLFFEGIEDSHLWRGLWWKLDIMVVMLMILLLKDSIDDPNSIILLMTLFHLSLFSSLLNHLFVPLDLYFKKPILILESTELLVVFDIISLDLFHAALHNVALSLNLRLNDFLVHQVHSLCFRVKNLAVDTAYFFNKALREESWWGLGFIKRWALCQGFVKDFCKTLLLAQICLNLFIGRLQCLIF